MQVRYLLGRAGSGKTTRIFNEIKEKLERDEGDKLILIVPDQFTYQAEIDFITSMDLEGLMKVEVLSFSRLAYRVFSQLGGPNKNFISNTGKTMILMKLFNKYSKDLSLYHKSSDYKGFISNFSYLISELKRNDITYKMLEEKLSSMEEGLLKSKLKDIAFIYQKYQEYIRDKYMDEEDRINQLIDMLDETDYLQNSYIWIDNFFQFSAQEFRLIEKLMEKSLATTIALTMDKDGRDKELFQPVENTLKALKEIVRKNKGQDEEIIIDGEIGYKTSDISNLERQIFSYPHKAYEDEVHNIDIFAASNRYSELENVACKIISLVRDKGYRWKDIALVTNSMSSYNFTIKRVFEEYNIPYFMDDKRNIMTSPIIKLVLSALSILSNNFKYEDVFKFIKTGFTGINEDQYEILENYVLRYGIQGDLWFKDFEYEDEKLDYINKIRQKFIKPFINFKEKVKGQNTILDLTASLFEFLEEMETEDRIKGWIQDLKDRGHFDYASENIQVWNIFIETMEQIVEILGDERVTISSYLRLIENTFMDQQISIIPPVVDQVFVGGLDRLGNYNVKALFLIGANDGILPSSQKNEGIFLDAEKITMKNMGLTVGPDNHTIFLNERLLIYSTLSKPNDYLWISYALTDDEGDALNPSIIIHRIKRLYSKLEIKEDYSDSIENEIRYIQRPLPTFKHLLKNIRKDLDIGSIQDIWWDVYDWYYNSHKWKENLIAIADSFFYNNKPENIAREYVKELYNPADKISISRIQQYVRCPFGYFIEYGLRPEDRLTNRLERYDVGTILHKVIEEFGKKIHNEGIKWEDLDKDKCGDLADEILDQILPAFKPEVLSSTHRYKYMTNKLRRIGKRAAWIMVEQIKAGKFRPDRFEVEFDDNPDSGLSPISIDLPEGQVKIRGKIDRVDLYEDGDKAYVRVIDYKTGNADFKLSDVYHGFEIQLIVYLDALLANKEILAKKDLYPAGIFYFKIDDPKIPINKNNAGDMERTLMSTLKLKGRLVKDIDIAKAMDMITEKGKWSPFIPVNITKAGSFRDGSSVIEEEDLKYLIRHVKELIKEKVSDILNGNISLEPYKYDGSVSCRYCDNHAICQFDMWFEGNTFKNIRKLKDEEVLKKLKESYGGEQSDKVD